MSVRCHRCGKPLYVDHGPVELWDGKRTCGSCLHSLLNPPKSHPAPESAVVNNPVHKAESA